MLGVGVSLPGGPWRLGARAFLELGSSGRSGGITAKEISMTETPAGPAADAEAPAATEATPESSTAAELERLPSAPVMSRRMSP